jgi:hypothetical protein
MCQTSTMTKNLTLIFVSFLSIICAGQKSNLYQVFADEINQQTFIDKKINKVEIISYLFDTVTGKLKEKSTIHIKYLPNKKLFRTTGGYIDHKPFYWKSDTNGVADFSYNRNGKRFKEATPDSAYFEENKLKSIYGSFLFFDDKNRVYKTTLDTVHTALTRAFFNECYYTYNGDDIIKTNCYQFQYNGKYIDRTDTIAKSIDTNDEYISEAFSNNKRTLTKTKKNSRDNVFIKETYINNKLFHKEETYYISKN